jgi:hypothetical protein
VGLKYLPLKWVEVAVVSAAYDADIKNAKAANKSREEIEKIEHMAQFEYFTYEDAIKVLQTRHLLSQAYRRSISTPEHNDDNWDRTSDTGESYLRPQAFAELRSAIRKERKERLEQVQMTAAIAGGIIGACTGVIGALIGLVTVLSK